MQRGGKEALYQIGGSAASRAAMQAGGNSGASDAEDLRGALQLRGGSTMLRRRGSDATCGRS